MFRCCDCGCEFEVKPDFCDCGNDTFEEITIANNFSEEEDIHKKKHKKTFEEQYPGLSSFMGTLDPISVIIFILCIILSFCSFIFIKPNENQSSEIPKEEQNIERKVADVNTFWNDTPPKPEPKITNQPQTTAENIVSQIINIIPKTDTTQTTPNTTAIPTQSKQSSTVQKTTQTQTTKPKVETTKPKTQGSKPKTQTKNSAQTTKYNANKSQNIQKAPQQTTNKTTTQTKSQQTVKPANQNTQQQQVQQTQQVQQIQQTQQIQQVQQPQIKPVNTISQQQAEQELKNFKKGLQSSFTSKIKGNLLQVYGDGSCIVDFKVDSTGKITNRSFSKQSTNNTLNDAVYQAVMSIPSYKSPPSIYKGQTLHLSVKITNGMVQISVY